MAPKKTEGPMEINLPDMQTVDLNIMGQTPLLYNAMSNKSKTELMVKSSGRKNNPMKVNPMEEFRSCVYMDADDGAPSLLMLTPEFFKGTMMNACTDLEGAVRAKIGRLTWVEGTKVSIYGVPQLHMRTVKNAGINGAPAIRTRAVLPNWCCRVSISYVHPQITSKSVVNLMAAAGMFIGVGDGRPQKGKLNYGKFVLVSDDDEVFSEIVRTGGRQQQIEAMKEPDLYDHETQQFYSLFTSEVDRLGLKEAV